MQDISNRTLALFLVAAIVVSVGGTLMVLNAAGPAGFKATGFASNNQTTGNVSLRVLEAVSIELVDAIIDFGDCTLLSGTDTYVNSSASNTSYNNSACTGPNGDVSGQDWITNNYDNILIKNNGNVYANVTVTSDVNSTDFFTSSTESGESYFRYWTTSELTQGNDYPGCLGSTQDTPTMFADTTTEYNACTNLSTGASNNTIAFYVDALIKPSVSATSETSTLTFTAYEA